MCAKVASHNLSTSMEYNPVGWFEIPVTDIAKAKAFYESVLSMQLEDPITQEGFEMAFFPGSMEQKPGASGAIAKGEGYVPGNKGVMIYFSCPDIEGACERAAAQEGEVVMPLTDIGEYGEMAWIKDPEGNTVGLHRMKQ